MKVPMWLRVSAVVFSAFLAGMYVAYATGFGGFIGEIFPHPYESPSPRDLDSPAPHGHTDFIPSSKWGGVFTPPSAAEPDEVDTESPTVIVIPPSALPELGLFEPEASASPRRFPIKGLERDDPQLPTEDIPKIDLEQRQFMPSTKAFSPLHVHPPQNKESK